MQRLRVLLRRAASEVPHHTDNMQDTLLDELRSIPLWHGYKPMPQIELPRLARHARIGRLFVKVEGARPLGNFKVLGGVLAGLRALARAMGAASIHEMAMARSAQAMPRLICASDGNHGLPWRPPRRPPGRRHRSICRRVSPRNDVHELFRPSSGAERGSANCRG